MSHRPSLAATLDSVISQLQALRVALDEEPSSEVPGTGSVTSFEWISPLEQEAPAESLPVSSNPSVGRAAPWTAAWDLALQLALTPGEFFGCGPFPIESFDPVLSFALSWRVDSNGSIGSSFGCWAKCTSRFA